MVRRYVSDRKPEILAASAMAPLEAFVPQTHLPGHEADVDFGDVTVTSAVATSHRFRKSTPSPS